MPLEYTPYVPMFIQYQNAPKTLEILQRLTIYLTLPIKQFYDNFFNIDTANAQGLDNWGRILNETRTISVPDYTNVFGFDTGIPPDPIDTGYPQNYDNGVFYGGQTISQTLTDDQFRILLKFRYLSYTINNSVGACMTVINNYIKGQYPSNPSYRCDIIEFNMSFAYNFNFILQPFEISLFKYNNVLPYPAGVGYEVYWEV